MTSEASTMRVVARRARVSVKTVSNVVNDYPHVALATRARVLAAISELGYRPNLSARHLRSGKTGIIALGIPSLLQPYFAELTAAVIQAARRRKLTVLVEETGSDRATERWVARGLGSSLISGVLLSPINLRPEDLPPASTDVPVVLLGEREHGAAHDHVLIDNVAAARSATGHLVEGGRVRVAAIGVRPEPTAATAQTRLQGFQSALGEAGLPLPPEYRHPISSFSREAGADEMRRLLRLSSPPDGVFCFNDLLALGAIRAAHEHGVRVPEDVAIVGFDDIEEASYSVPTLTTIAPDKAELSRLAVSLLADRIAGEGTERRSVKVEVSYRLEVRESSGPKPPAGKPRGRKSQQLDR